MTGRSSWMHLRWLVAVGVLVGGLGVAALPAARAQEGGQGELETAALAPADTLLFVSLNTDVSSDQWTLAADLLDQGGLEDIVYGTVTQLFVESGLPAEWITPGSSFLGDEVSVVVTSGGPNGADAYVVLSSANPNQAFETARSAYLATTEAEYVAPVYEEEGLTVVSSSIDETSLARVDDLIVFGTSTGVQEAIGVAYGAEPPLADQPAFEELVDELEDDRIATAWANGPAVGAARNRLLGGEGVGGLGMAELSLLGPPAGVATVGYSAVGMWAEEEGFRLDARVLPGPRDDELTAPDEATELAERASADTLLFLDGMDLGQIPIIRSYLDSIAFATGAADVYDENGATAEPTLLPTLDESYATLENLLGFDLRADLLDQLEGDYGLWVSTSSLEDAGEVTAVLVSDVTDPATVDASVDRLITLLRLDSGDDLTIDRFQVAGTAVTEILVPDGTGSGPLRLTVGVVDGQLLLGVGTGMEQYLDGPLEDSLADADRFDAAFDALPDDDGGRFYLDLNQLIELQELAALEPTGAIGDPLDDPQLAALDGIQALAAVTRMDDETQVTSVVLTIDDSVDPDADEVSTPDATPEGDDDGGDASPVAGGRPRVADTVPVGTGSGRLLAMSPSDGAFFIERRDGELCVHDAGGTDCVRWEERVDPRHIAWSPDGRRVAFTEDAAVYLYDSDVWVFDRDRGSIDNWTDDGYRGGIPLTSDADDVPTPLPVDLTPTWTDDGAAIVFARTMFGSATRNYTTILYRVDGPGAEPGAIAPVAFFPFATYGGLGYAPDGSLAYTVGSPDVEDPSNGLYVLSPDGRSVRQVAQADDELGTPYFLGVTSNDQALVSYPLLAGIGDPRETDRCPVGLVDLVTTERTPLIMPDATCATFAGIAADGARIVLFSSSSGRAELAIVDAERPDEAIAIEGGEALSTEEEETSDLTPGYAGNGDLGLTTTDDGRLFLRRGLSDGVLIQLAAVDAATRVR